MDILHLQSRAVQVPFLHIHIGVQQRLIALATFLFFIDLLGHLLCRVIRLLGFSLSPGQLRSLAGKGFTVLHQLLVCLPVDPLADRRHCQKPKGRSPGRKSQEQHKEQRDPGALFVHGLAHHKAAFLLFLLLLSPGPSEEKSFFLPVQPGGHTGLFVYLLQKTQGSGIGLVYPGCFFQDAPGFVPFFVFDPDKGQQMIAFDQFGILSQDLLKLYGGHIFMSFPAQRQGMVIFPDRLVDGLQLIGIRLQLVDVF